VELRAFVGTWFRRGIVAPLLGIIVGLTLVASALAGGGPDPEPAPVNFYPDDPNLSSVVVNQAGHALLTGAIACTKAGQGTISLGLTEYDAEGNAIASGSGKRTAACAAGGSHRVTVEILPEPGKKFAVGGTGYGGIEFEYDTVPGPGGVHYPGQMFAPLLDVQFVSA
jgi:hypothetical protein